MAQTAKDLFDLLESLDIAVATVEHDAVFTVEESHGLHERIPGAHSKNLFLKDKKGRLFLVVAEQESRIELKRLHERIGASGRLSFGSADALFGALGVTPGSVTPFALINDCERRVGLVLDRRIAEAPVSNFHPLANTATTSIAAADLMKFFAATGHEPLILDFDGAEAAADL